MKKVKSKNENPLRFWNKIKENRRVLWLKKSR